MRKILIVIFLISLVWVCFYINRQNVTVVDTHYNGHSAEVLVDRLSFSDSAKIYWWEKNQNDIWGKYHIPADKSAPLLITIYAFGEGYKEEGKEDRLCFKKVKPPKNCIDKKSL